MPDKKKSVIIQTLLLFAFVPLLGFSCLLIVLSSFLNIGNIVSIVIVLLVAFVVYLCAVILYFSMAENKTPLQMIKDILKRS